MENKHFRLCFHILIVLFLLMIAVLTVLLSTALIIEYSSESNLKFITRDEHLMKRLQQMAASTSNFRQQSANTLIEQSMKNDNRKLLFYIF